MPLALSTSWNAFRHTQASSMLFEIKNLGFKNVELSFNLTGSMLDQMPKATEDLGFKVISLHNYCPIPEGLSRDSALPDCFSLSSIDEAERTLAVKYTKRTIDKAESLGAPVVVLHCGRVEIEDKTRQLISLYEKGANKTEEFIDLKEAFIKERLRESLKFLEMASVSLKELSLYAEDKGVSLGIENRFYYREIPSFEELGIMLSGIKSKNLFYWHDSGHARVMQNLGLTGGGDFLSIYGERMIGIHLHNVSGCRDHLPLLNGDLNISDFKPYLKSETIKVIEVHHPATAIDIEESRKYVERAFEGVI